MTDEATTILPEEPEWVHEMRAKGYTVRVGTGTRGLPYHPDVSFHEIDEPPRGLRRRLVELVRNLWSHRATLRRFVHR